MPVAIIDKHFPLVIGLVAGDVDESDIQYMERSYAQIHSRKERFFLAQETRRVSMPNAVIRKRLGQMNDGFGPLITKHVVGINVIVANRIFAGALKAVYWLSREYAPTDTADSAVDMLVKARKSCEAEDLVIPTSADSLAEQLDTAFKNGSDFMEFIEAASP
jgi:hypothetical protein